MEQFIANKSYVLKTLLTHARIQNFDHQRLLDAIEKPNYMSGETLLITVSTCINLDACEMLLAIDGVRYNYIDTAFACPEFIHSKLVLCMLENGINPFVVRNYGKKSQFDLRHCNFQRNQLKKFYTTQEIKEIENLLQKFSKAFKPDMLLNKPTTNPSTSIHYSIEDQICGMKNCKDELKAFVCYPNLKSSTKSRQLGTGATSTVYEGYWHGKMAAFKHVGLNMKSYGSIFIMKDALEKNIDEINCQKKLHHENILEVWGHFRQQHNGHNETIFVFPKCDYNLNAFQQSPAGKPAALMEIILQTIDGLKYIKDNDQIHGDIKPGNLLILNNRSSIKLKIADFGLVGRDGGTPIFMAPESLSKKMLEKTDVYSLGITILFLAFDIDVAMRLLYLPIVGSIVDFRGEMRHIPLFWLITQMIRVKPEDRPSLIEIKSELTNLGYINLPIKIASFSLTKQLHNLLFALSGDMVDDLLGDIMMRNRILAGGSIENYSCVAFKSTYKNKKELEVGSRLISQEIHDQRQTDWQCWAYAIATMLRTSLCLLLDGLTKKEPLKSDLSNFVKLLKIECQKVKLKNSNHHKRMRMELMLIVFPIRGNTSAEGVDPKTVIDRLVFPTILHPRGIKMMNTITSIIENLPMEINCKKEVFHHPKKEIYWPGKAGTFDDAIEQKKTPVTFADDHAITLYSKRDNLYYCKNTYDHQPEISIPVDDIPNDWDFVYASNISFLPCTKSADEVTTSQEIRLFLTEMEFKKEIIDGAMSQSPCDSDGALKYVYQML